MKKKIHIGPIYWDTPKKMEIYYEIYYISRNIKWHIYILVYKLKSN